jgi:hypothetical protein
MKPMVLKYGFSGEFRLILRDENLKAVYDSGWGDNTILDAGLDNIGLVNVFTYWHIGDSSAAVAEAQTGLQGWLASSTTQVGSTTSAYGGSPNYEQIKTVTRRFIAGVGTGTIREVGAGSNVANDVGFYARHLVSPEIVKGVDNVLDVAYRHTMWPPLVDVAQSGILTMDGEVFDTLLRAANVDKTSYNGAMTAPIGLSIAGGSNNRRVYDGDIGIITEVPTGNNTTSVGTRTNLVYTPGNHYRDLLIEATLDQANTSTDEVRSELTEFTTGLMQVQFDSQSSPGSGIPKDETKIMDRTYRVAWGRH